MDNLEFLRATNNIGYGSARIPSLRDSEIVSLLGPLLSSDGAPGLRELGDQVRSEQCSALEAFAERAASWAVRQNDVGIIEVGLLALGLAARRGDPREIAMSASLLWRAAELISASPGLLFARTETRLGATEGGALSSFANRKGADRSIEAMGFRESEDADGFRFVYATDFV